jgi:hypothetical protein
VTFLNNVSISVKPYFQNSFVDFLEKAFSIFKIEGIKVSCIVPLFGSKKPYDVNI